MHLWKVSGRGRSGPLPRLDPEPYAAALDVAPALVAQTEAAHPRRDAPPPLNRR